MEDVTIPAVIFAIVVVLLVIVFNRELFNLVNALRDSLISALGGRPRGPKLSCGCVGVCACGMLPDEEDFTGGAEHAESGAEQAPNPLTLEDQLMMEELGYEGELPWQEVLQATELDPSTHTNHQAFVADVRRFSSGANFTAVAEDNTNLAFVNFRGLRRPQHVPIGEDARQQPDINQDVLQRNKSLRF